MSTETMIQTISLRQKDQLRKTSSHMEVISDALKYDITMHRGECSVYGCNCREYVGANVGTCENCGHHYDSHRY